ncbi:MAG: M4 family metallopeptidase, partial [Psychrosphaera sp.]|nr:M4 family metallopeptidase [Psychrosphaera sp.]
MKTHNISKICAALGCAFALSNPTVALASTNAATIQNAASLAKGFSAYNINEVIGFTGDNQLIPKHQVNLGNGMFKTRFVQHYQGIPIFGHSVSASQSAMGLVFDVKGQVVNFDNQLLLTKPRLSAQAAMQKLLNHEPALKKLSSKAAQAIVSNKSNQLFIYMQDDKPLLVHRISYKVQGETGEPAIPVYFVNAHSGKIVLSYDNLQHAKIGTGPGGNAKTGIYQYGSDFDFLDVSQNDQTCTMENANVKTIDLNHGTSGSGSEAFSYTCPENTSKPINGAASPLNDGHYFGNMVYDMYNDYIGESPLEFQMCVKVHYGNNHENAFWDGTCMTFGDGGSNFYPLVVLDLMSHEVSHGFSERHTGFVFFGHSGSISESFSDLAGEAAEYYMKGNNDWLVAADVFKSDDALRYLQDPTLDGLSIDHACDFTSATDVHNGSGVYNKA